MLLFLSNWNVGKKRPTSKFLCQTYCFMFKPKRFFCWNVRKKTKKTPFWERTLVRVINALSLILLVCKHPDSLKPIPLTLSGVSFSSRKNREKSLLFTVYCLQFTVYRFRFWCYASSLLRHGKAQTSLVSAHGLNAAFRLCGSLLHHTSYIIHL